MSDDNYDDYKFACKEELESAPLDQDFNDYLEEQAEIEEIIASVVEEVNKKKYIPDKIYKFITLYFNNISNL